jgi:hypothetical protein
MAPPPRFHAPILAATRDAADLTALMALAREGGCVALEEPAVRLAAALACLGGDAARRALM